MNESPLRFVPSFAVLICAVLGCSRSASSVGEGSAPTQIEVDGSGGAFLSGLPAELRATFGTAPTIEMGFMAERDATWITLDARLSLADIGAGTAVTPLTNAPLDVDLATVQLGGVAGAPDFGSGTVRLQIASQTIAGTITAASDSSAWTFAGTMGVECWAPESEVGAQPGGGTSSVDGSEPLVPDTNFITPECAPFRGLAGL
jgi:hypothetical protein